MSDNDHKEPPFDRNRLPKKATRDRDMPFNRPGGVDPFKDRSHSNKPKRAASTEPAEEAALPARAKRSANPIESLPPRREKAPLPPRLNKNLPVRGQEPVSRAKSDEVVVDEQAPSRAKNISEIEDKLPKARRQPPLPPRKQGPLDLPPKATQDAPDAPETPEAEPVKAELPKRVKEAPKAAEEPLDDVEKATPAPKRSRKDRVINLKEEFGEWDKDNTEEEEEEAASGAKKFINRQRNFRITERDLTLINFFARYRYGTKEQAADLVDTTTGAINGRILKMGHAGFLRKENVANGKGVWTPTTLGLGVIDSDFKALGSNSISLVTMAHTLGLGNIGLEVEIGNASELLGMPVDTTRTITEREISSSYNHIKKTRETRESMAEFEFVSDEGIILDDPEYNPDGRSPEMVPGNEGLFVIEDEKFHVPDMVIPLPRDEDGFPRSIGIELELNTKPDREWTRILMSYRESTTFGKVIYFTHKKPIMTRLVSIAKGLGLNEDQFDIRKYTPKTAQLILG